jgi:hypothetical protein
MVLEGMDLEGMGLEGMVLESMAVAPPYGAGRRSANTQ